MLAYFKYENLLKSLINNFKLKKKFWNALKLRK